MKNLIIMILFFAGLTGCSDYPSEPTIVYRSAGVKNTAVASDKNQQKKSTGSPSSSQVLGPKSKGESDGDLELTDEQEFNAKALIKEDLKLSVNLSTKTTELTFDIPLESGLNSSNKYFYEMQFFKAKIDEVKFKAMRALKRYLRGDYYSGDEEKSTLKKHCVIRGRSLQSLGRVGCSLDDDVDINIFRNLDLKSVIILFHNDGDSVNDSESAELNDARGKGDTFGYRCLRDKKTSTDWIVNYHRCRYPKPSKKS